MRAPPLRIHDGGESVSFPRKRDHDHRVDGRGAGAPRITGPDVSADVGLLLYWRTVVLVSEYTFFFLIPVLVFTRTSSLSASALASIVEFLPRVLMLPFFLLVLDRVRLGWQIAVSDVLRAALLAVIVVDAPVPVLLLALGAFGVVSMWSVITFEKVVASIAPSQAQRVVIARSQGLDQLARVAGGVAAMVAIEAPGLVGGVCLGFLGSGYLALHFYARGAPSDAPRRVLSRAPRSDTRKTAPGRLAALRPLAVLIALLVAVNLVDGLVRTLLPALAIAHHAGPAEAVPAVMTMSYLLGAALSVAFERVSLKLGERRILAVSITILVCALGAMAAAPNAVAFYLGAVVFFGARVWFNIIGRLARNRIVDHRHLGSVMALYLPAVFLPFVAAGSIVALLAYTFEAFEILWGVTAFAALGALALAWVADRVTKGLAL